MTQKISKHPLQKNCLVIPCGDNGYDFTFVEHEVFIEIPFIRDNGRGLQAELTIEAPPGTPIKSNFSLNLSDPHQRTRLALDLVKTHETVLPWDEILEYAISETIRRYRIPPELQDISADPENKAVEYLIEPLLALNQPTTIFSSGGKGKSILADFVAVIVTQHIAPFPPFMPREAKVLYLDWEADVETHRRYITAIEKGFGFDEHKPILYLNCEQPLSYYKSYLRQLVEELDIGLIILDSQMAATAGNPQGMTEAQVAGQYYNDLRFIGGRTTLTIDHMTKQSMRIEETASSPYGSVVKYNRSRSQYELKQTQEPEADIMELALVHVKFNLGKKSKPLGIRIAFSNTETGELEQIDFSTFDIASNVELVKALPLKSRVKDLLLDAGALSISDIATSLDANEPSVKTILYREKKVFIKMGDTWGVKEIITK